MRRRPGAATTGARVRMRKSALAGIDDGELVVFLGPRQLAAIAARR